MKRGIWLFLILMASLLVGCKPEKPLPKQAQAGPAPAAAVTAPAAAPTTLNVMRLVWTDSKELPAMILESNQQRGRFGLMAHVSVESSKAFTEFLKQADARVLLEPEDKQSLIKINFDPGCWWFENGAAWIYVPFGPTDRRDLKSNIPYRVRPQNHAAFAWNFDQTVVRD